MEQKPSPGTTREKLDKETITKEIGIIKNELHCNAIRISGLDINRISLASEIALNLGLTVWFSPALHYDGQVNTLQYIIKGAAAAEKLRRVYPNIIYVSGCELSLFTSGFIEGDTGEQRMKNMFSPLSMVKNMLGIKRAYNRKLNIFLGNAVKEIRKQFSGQITYSSGTWEKINWGIFDIIGIDHYRAAYNKPVYLKVLQGYQKMNKPVSIMEFGCCTYKGAVDKGAMGWAIVDWKKDKPELKGEYVRDEDAQAKHILELLNIFETEKVFAAFVFTFISSNYVYNDDPKYDLDMAAYGIVRAMADNIHGCYGDLPWLPKRSFFALGNYYGSREGASV